jgi:GGDEF domain-containing protein
LAEEVLIRLANGPEELQVDAGIAVYPEHGLDAGEIVGAAMAALNMAKRVGGSGIVVAQTR